MNHNNHYIIFIFIFSVLLHLSVCHSSSSLYNTCFPKTCGDVSISYPFHIAGEQKTYCGYPGFEVTCQNGSNPGPYLNISGYNYLIKKIWYENQTFEVVNSVFLNTGKQDQCADSIRNLTFVNGLFEFATNHNDLLLLIKCPAKYLSEYQQYMVNCGALAVGENDPGFGDLRSECDRVATVPYEDDVIIKNGNFEEALQRGVVLSWMGTENCNDCAESGGQCGFDQSLSTFQCYCSDRPRSHQCTRRTRLTLIIISATAASAMLIVLFIVLVLYSRRRRSVNRSKFLGIKGKMENQNVEAYLKSYGYLAPKRYTYTNIKKMTVSFKDKLGEGGYGHVYKGKLLDGRTVAVKVLKKVNGNGEEFLNEVVSISRTNHVNVVTLLGFCFEGRRRALVYQFMPNGSLEKFIHGARSGQPLPCETLFNISVGIARGLDYLHRGCNTRILHFDIKPHNILLDEKFSPKISDFGLARLFPKEQSHLSSFEARGTIGYIAPEVFCRNFGGVSHKSDVYSFGMMIIDMVCGRNNASAGNQCSSD